MDKTIKLVNKMLRPLRHRVNNMVLQGQLLFLNHDKTPAAQVVTVNDEIVDNVKYMQDYGFYSRPLKDSEAILLKIQGNPGNVVAVKIGSRELRFQGLNNGEVAIADNSGSYIYLKNGGNMDITAPKTINATAKTVNVNAGSVVVNAETATVNGKVFLAGGGQPVARLGDTVEVDPQTHKGFITSGSTEVTAG